MHGQLYCGHTNATALFSGPVVSALGSELDDPGSSPSQGKALCPWDVQEKKKVRAPLLGLAKSIYYNWHLLCYILFQADCRYVCFYIDISNSPKRGC